MKRYTESQDWMEEQEGIVTVGVSQKALTELGAVIYVELPRLGTQLLQGAVAAVVESTKAAVDLYAPTSGEVVAVNAQLVEDPTLLCRDPEGAGWLYRLRSGD